MSSRNCAWLGCLGVVVALGAAAATPIAGQVPGTTAAAGGYVPARTPWGDPDLQGYYTNKDENGIPLERPDQFGATSLEDAEESSEFADIVRERNARALANAARIGGAETGAGPVHWYEHYDARNSRPWLLVDPPDGRMPAQLPAADARAAARRDARAGRGPADSYEDRSNYDRCISRGLPGSMMPAIYGNAYQIVQGPGFAAIRYEMIHEARIIPLDGSRHLGGSIRPYMGDGRGRWEGNTLVIETTNFNDQSSYRGSNAEALRLVERFTPVAPDKVEWSVTVEDATTWERPWTFAMNLTRDDTQLVFEYACHEGNRGLANILSAARSDEETAAAGGR
jgi:hypothetical protein